MSIEEKITKTICNFCYQGKSEDEREIIEYGIALLVETCFKMLVLMIFAIIIGRFYEYVCFLLVFCTVRTQAGGFHCKSNLGCTSTVFIIYIASLVFEYFQPHAIVALISYLVCFIICLIFAPSSTENNPITDKKIRIRKKIICLVLLTLFYLEYAFSVVHIAKGCIFSAFISIIILVLLQECKRRNIIK